IRWQCAWALDGAWHAWGTHLSSSERHDRSARDRLPRDKRPPGYDRGVAGRHVALRRSLWQSRALRRRARGEDTASLSSPAEPAAGIAPDGEQEVWPEGISPVEWAATPAAVRRVVVAQQEHVEAWAQQVADLERRLKEQASPPS